MSIKGIRYYLSAAEIRKLRLVCRFTQLRFEACAARPITARHLIASHYQQAKEALR